MKEVSVYPHDSAVVSSFPPPSVAFVHFPNSFAHGHEYEHRLRSHDAAHLNSFSTVQVHGGAGATQLFEQYLVSGDLNGLSGGPAAHNNTPDMSAPVVNVDSNALTTRSSSKASSESDEDARSHVCDVCKRSFKTLYHLRRHARTHEGIYPFLCPVCYKAFRDKSGLKRHYVMHTGDHPCKCDYCGRGFAETAKLKKHLQTHTGNYRFKCEICDKGFTESYYLKNHLSSHSDLQWFSCTSCDKKYTCQKSLQRHIAVDHNGQERTDKKSHKKRKPFSGTFRCNACNETFSMREPYVQHMRRHAGPPQSSGSSQGRSSQARGYLCLKCDLTFPDDFTFRAHARAHSEVVQPSTNQPSSVSSSRSSKNSHNKHDPPASCPICNKRLSRQSHMKRHMWSVHKMVEQPTVGHASAVDVDLKPS